MGKAIRDDFPLLRGQDLVYLDSAATAQKPDPVLRTLEEVYTRYNANVHRSPHRLGREMTVRYEEARERLARFFGVGDALVPVFTRGTTEAVNLAASSILPLLMRREPDRKRVIVTVAEHHSNFVPWQQWCQRMGMEFVVLPLTGEGLPDLKELERLLTRKTALLASAHVSNVTGIRFPVEEMAEMAHRAGAVMLVDGAQAVGHIPVKVGEIGCDFYALSGHKMYGPNGIGLLFGRKDLLEEADPWQYGGEMVNQVEETWTTFAPVPLKYEAGTPDYAEAVGLAAAVGYLEGLGGMEEVEKQGSSLYRYLWETLSSVGGIRILAGPGSLGSAPAMSRNGGSILSFTMEGFHPFDVASLLDAQGIAVRCGSHCAQPLMRFLGTKEGTVRVSLGIYNTEEDIDRLAEALCRIRRCG